MSAAASAKHENFVMSTSHTARAGRRQTARSTLLMYVVHLVRLKAPCKAAGQIDLLTVPSADGVDSKVIQVEEALSASSRDPAKAISIPQRQTRASSPARDAHGVMPNSRQAPSSSRQQRSTSRKMRFAKVLRRK